MQFCTVDGNDGDFRIIRRGEKNTRVVRLGEQESVLVPTSAVHLRDARDPGVPARPQPIDDSTFRLWMKQFLDG